jgi:hypothetical protein
VDLLWARTFSLAAPFWTALPLQRTLSAVLLGRALIRVRLCLVHIRFRVLAAALAH